MQDPLGVIQAYRLAKIHYPKLQLVLAGGDASDDPEGDQVLKETKKNAEEDPMQIDLVNKIIGVSNKNESIQKKIRSEIINEINNKWKILQKTNRNLIVRKRSDLDKRTFEYWLEKEAFNVIKKIF